jgi:transcriptional regulator
MYCPAPFQESRPEVLRMTIAKYPLAALVTAGVRGIAASHMPLLYHAAEDGLGVLRGHLARPNPQWQEYEPGSEALAIFSGPQHYITPRWYPSKQADGRVVPTWNYVTVHVRGTLAFHSDAAWLRENVQALTESQEGSNEAAWRVSDAPGEYIEKMLGAIVGVEMRIAAWEGKWKLSQNRPPADHEGVIHGLEALDSANAREMARIMKSGVPV